MHVGILSYKYILIKLHTDFSTELIFLKKEKVQLKEKYFGVEVIEVKLCYILHGV